MLAQLVVERRQLGGVPGFVAVAGDLEGRGVGLKGGEVGCAFEKVSERFRVEFTSV
jgi:hypothetical protein